MVNLFTAVTFEILVKLLKGVEMSKVCFFCLTLGLWTKLQKAVKKKRKYLF